MNQVAVLPSEAFLQAYETGYELMLELQTRPPESLSIEDLEAVGQHLVQAIEIDPSVVQPYVLLASIFLVAGNRQMAEKYISLAEEIWPDFPKLLELKEHMMTPPSLLRQKNKQARAGGILPVSSIQRLRPMNETKPAQSSSDLFRFPDK